MRINYKDEFEEKILSRGYEYYKQGLVENVHEEGDVIVAKVSGTSVYQVFVYLEDHDLMEAGCSCPYASEGLYCKHIAALLYYLEEHDIEECSGIYQSKKQEIRGILRQIDKQDLEDFLVKLLESDEHIYDQFRLKFHHLFPVLTLAQYRKKIYDAIRSSGGRDGFIDYQEAWDYVNAMSQITEEVEALVSHDHYELAFDVATSILETIPNTDIDDSDGSTGDVADSCIQIIERILDQVLEKDEKLSLDILQYIFHETMTDYLSNYGIELYELFRYYIDGKVYLEKIEQHLVHLLKMRKNDEYCWHRKYYVDYLVSIYDIGNHQEKILELLEEYSFDYDVCFRLVDEYMRIKDGDKAIQLLKDRLEETGSVNDARYAFKLSDIYFELNMMEEYKQILYQLLYDLSKYNIEVYKKIKKLYSRKEWLVERQKIIDKVLKEKDIYFYHILNIYIEEKMYDDIYSVVKDKEMDVIVRYETYLLPKYNQELIGIYLDRCREFAKVANNRNLYRKLASDLRHIKEMKHSKVLYEKLLSEIRLQYRNRPAMQDELRGL